MPRWQLNQAASLLLVLGICYSDLPAAAGATETLHEALRDRPATRLLELSFADGQFARGYPIAVRNDTLHLRQDEFGGPVTLHPLTEIVRVRAWHSNAGRGAGWGASSGAIVVGGFGTLVGLAVASYDSDNSDDLAPVFSLTLIGAGVGALAGGLLGSGMGALISSWHTIWQADGGPTLPEPPTYSQATRLGLFAGAGRTLLDDYEVTRFVGRISLHKTMGERVSLGPVISYHDFGGHVVTSGPGFTEVKNKEDLLMLAFSTSIQARRTALTPYATAGVGWFLGNDPFIGGHLGGGLRWQATKITDLELDIRYHFSFTDVDDDQIDRFWTLGLGFRFGI